MPTTGSSGLNNLVSSTAVTQTTLPSWYDTAQQKIANQAGSISAPSFGQTTGQQAVNTLQGANNPFTQAQGTLNQIATGAANPWLTSASGQVTPNTNTALGGLFAAQNQQLNQVLPNIAAPAEAGAIGSGNFGSLRGQTAVNKAKADALANLQAQQMTAALQGQQYGSQAAANLGNVGAQGITAGLTTGTAQMNAPYQGATNYANLINAINAPTTVSSQVQNSPLDLLAKYLTAGSAGLTALAGSSIGQSLIKSLFPGGSSSDPFSGTVTQPTDNSTTPLPSDPSSVDSSIPPIDTTNPTIPPLDGTGSGETTSGGPIDTSYDTITYEP